MIKCAESINKTIKLIKVLFAAVVQLKIISDPCLFHRRRIFFIFIISFGCVMRVAK